MDLIALPGLVTAHPEEFQSAMDAETTLVVREGRRLLPCSIAVGNRAGVIRAERQDQSLQPHAWSAWPTDARFCR